MNRYKSWTIKMLSTKELMLSNCGSGENSWESLGLQGDQTSQSQMKSALNIHWKDWCWSWSSNTLATWWEAPADWKRPWCWERFPASLLGRQKGKKEDEMAVTGLSPVRGSFFHYIHFSHSVMFDSLQPHGLQHSRFPCPSPTPGIHSNSCPLSRWSHLTISSSVIPFSSCLQSFPASGSCPVSQLFKIGQLDKELELQLQHQSF